MGHSPDHFGIYVWLSCASQAVALLRLSGGCIYSGWVLQFAAAHFCLLAGLSGHSEIALVVGAVLMAIVVAIPFRFARSWSIRALGAACVLVLAGLQASPWLEHARMLERGIRANAGDKWYAGDDLRIPQVATMLKPRRGEARMVDFAYPIKLQWPAIGKGRCSVVIGNAGRFEDWKVWEGEAQLVPGPDSHLVVRCEFPATGGQCRIGPRIRSDASSRKVLVLGGLHGDLAALDALLEQLKDEVPDAVFLCGDMSETGEAYQLLAIRDRIDSLGSRVVAIPGEEEDSANPRSPYRTWMNARSAANASVYVGGVSALLFDASSGSIEESSVNNLILHSAAGAQRGYAVAALHRPLIAPPGRESECLNEGRALMLKSLRPWATSAVFSCTDSAAFELHHEGIRHISVGGNTEEVAAAMVTLDRTSVRAVRWLKAARRPESVSSLRATIRGICAYSMEYIELTHDFMRGLGWVFGLVLSLPVSALLSRKRRMAKQVEHGVASVAPSQSPVKENDGQSN